MAIIKESFLLTADNADVLSAPSRLAAIPADGILSIEASATDCDATNFARMSLQLPGGEIPFEDLHIAMSGQSTVDAVMNSESELVMQIAVKAGGHVLLSYDETGTVALTLIYVTLAF